MRPFISKALIIVFSLLYSLMSFSQIATSSFNKYQLSMNPSAAATRAHTVFSASYTRDNSFAKFKQSRGTDSTQWREKLTINKNEFILATAGRKYSSELYLSADNLKKSLALVPVPGQDSQDQSNDIKFINNFANFAYTYSHRVFFGVKFFLPKVSFKSNYTFTFADSKKVESETDTTDSYLGLGAGVTLKLTKFTYVGFYYNRTKISSSGTRTTTDEAGKVSNSLDSTSFTYQTKGIGLAFERGNSSTRGVRAEVAYSMMNYPFSDASENKINPIQVMTSLDIAIWGVVLGGTVRFTKGPYRDNTSIIKDSIDPPITADKFEASYEYFFSFVSKKGHGIGFTGSYKAGEGKKKLFGVEQPATMITSVIGLTYSYTF